MLADEQALTNFLSHQIGRQPDPEATNDAKRKCSALRDQAGADLGLPNYTRLSWV
jgi:hypothetical protein